MTQEELEDICAVTREMADMPERTTLKSYVFRLLKALEAALEKQRLLVKDIENYDAALCRPGSIWPQYSFSRRPDHRDAYKYAAEQAIWGPVKIIDGQLSASDIPAHVADLHRQLTEVTRQRDDLISRLNRGEYIYKKCGLRKNSEQQPAEF